MANGVVLQIARGVFANMPTLAVGQLYLATDTGGVYIGSATGNVAVGGGASRIASFNYTMDGGGHIPTLGAQGQINVPVSCTLTGWTITSDQPGTAVVDVLHSTYPAFPATVSIAGTDKPTLPAVSITPVGGTGNSTASTVTTITASYVPTAGNAVVVFVRTSAAVTALTVKDSSANPLVAGPVSNNLASFYYSAFTGITGFTATWTTGAQASITVAEYGNVNAVIALAGSHSNASSAIASQSITTTATNSWIVCGLTDNSSNAFTATVGNQRQTSGATGTTRLISMDNTVTSPSAVACTASLTLCPWDACGLELQPIAGSQKNEDLTLTGWVSTALTAGDQLQFNLNSVSGCTRINISLPVTIP
jgi:hypothetical protein